MKIHYLLIFWGLSVVGCAYQWAGAERHFPKEYTKVHVKMFQNRSQEVGIEAELTNTMIQQIARSGLGQVVPRKDSQFELKGIIYSIDFLGKTPISSGRGALFTEYQTRVSLMVEAIDTKTNESLWSQQFLGERSYRAPQLTEASLRTANPLYTQSAKRRIIKEIAQDMSSEVLMSMTERF